ncbi:hypothetical protein B0H10DRAFT_2226218 [Mycena sp. CBHHK59/15]|nr:hypothetical protein B0H10DRAFT_2226218 [Mycena sp. CBHHK59/15]
MASQPQNFGKRMTDREAVRQPLVDSTITACAYKPGLGPEPDPSPTRPANRVGLRIFVGPSPPKPDPTPGFQARPDLHITSLLHKLGVKDGVHVGKPMSFQREDIQDGHEPTGEKTTLFLVPPSHQPPTRRAATGLTGDPVVRTAHCEHSRCARRTLSLDCCMGLLRACGEGVSAVRPTGAFVAMQQHEGKTQRQLPPTAHALRERGAACISGRVDAVHSEVHRYVPALPSPLPSLPPAPLPPRTSVR